MNQADIVTVKSSEQNDIQAQLQEEYFKSFESLEEGQLIEGTVVQIAGGEVFVDIGYKSEGKIPETEFSELPEIGKTVSVLFVSKEDKNGDIVISKRGADIKQAWITLKQAFQKAEPVEGMGINQKGKYPKQSSPSYPKSAKPSACCLSQKKTKMATSSFQSEVPT